MTNRFEDNSNENNYNNSKKYNKQNTMKRKKPLKSNTNKRNILKKNLFTKHIIDTDDIDMKNIVNKEFSKFVKDTKSFQDKYYKKDFDFTESNIKKDIENILPAPIDSLESLEDLIVLAKLAKTKETEKIQFVLPIQRLSKILEPLQELSRVIGLDYIKNKLVEQIIYLVTHCDEKEPPMLHTIIDGPPGTGKTKIARIIGKIISNIGYLKKNKPKKDESSPMMSIAKLVKDTLVIDIVPEEEKENDKKGIVKYVTRCDLVGGYLGQTAIKTQKAIDEASGGVLIIDEAYSLGGKRGDDTDSYSQECIDTLVSNLSENRSFVCIILGYSEELDSSFINQNKGLDSRFPFRYSIKNYTIENLIDILKEKISNEKYTFSEKSFNILKSKNVKDFKYLGRDMEVLWFKIKMIQTKRIFLDNKSDKNTKKEIIDIDVKKGLDKFFNDKNTKKEIDYYKLSMFT